MTSIKTATDAEATSALNAEYRRLALAASQGDAAASKLLMAVEDKIDAMTRRQRRQDAAEVEAQRVTVLEQEAATQSLRQDLIARRDALYQQRDEAFAEIEIELPKLADAVKFALVTDKELWATMLQLEAQPETRTQGRITNYIANALGRTGAGLSDLPAVYASGLIETSLVRHPVTEGAPVDPA